MLTAWQCAQTWPVEIRNLFFLADLEQECESTAETAVNSDDKRPDEELHPPEIIASSQTISSIQNVQHFFRA